MTTTDTTTEGVETPEAASFRLGTGVLMDALKTALEFVRPGDPQLGGVHLCGGPETLRVSASDQYILSVETLKVAGTPFPFTLARSDCRLLITLLDRFEGRVEVSRLSDSGKTAFRLDNYGNDESVTLHLQALESSDFPDLQDILDRYPEGDFDRTALAPGLLATIAEAAQDRYSTEPLEFIHQTPEMLVFRQGPLTIAVKPMHQATKPDTRIKQPRPCHPEGTQP